MKKPEYKSTNTKNTNRNSKKEIKKEIDVVRRYIKQIDKAIAQDLNFYMGIISRYNTNDGTACKKALDRVEAGVVDVYSTWDENDFVGSILKIHNKYRKLTSILPKEIAVEINDKVDKMMSKYFNQLFD